MQKNVGEIYTSNNIFIKQNQINKYAEASGDNNPIHLDEDFAQKSNFGGIVAHGMLILAQISELLTSIFGINWAINGHLDVRFRRPVYVKDSIQSIIEIVSIELKNDKSKINCKVSCVKNNDDLVIVGTAIIYIPEQKKEN
jgi:3-hydroxybutyryl-CoA dehydratase